MKSWRDDKGIGFITREDDSEVFVHHSALKGQERLFPGNCVEFEVVPAMKRDDLDEARSVVKAASHAIIWPRANARESEAVHIMRWR